MISSTQSRFFKNCFRATFQTKVVLLVLIYLTALNTITVAQDTIPMASISPVADTAIPEVHSAHKATLYSLALPGLGQAYNRKYWKIPVIYVGFGALVYNFKINNDEMKKFTEAYRYVTNKDSFPIDNEYITRYPDPDDLLRGREFYRRRVELTVIISAAWYILNVIDAAVDAHFFDYDISDNLSLRLDPVFMMPTGKQDRYATGLRLSLNL
ncbi:MAG: DUF5683 domain-containing protein [Bacteroidota bacterium]